MVNLKHVQFEKTQAITITIVVQAQRRGLFWSRQDYSRIFTIFAAFSEHIKLPPKKKPQKNNLEGSTEKSRIHDLKRKKGKNILKHCDQ